MALRFLGRAIILLVAGAFSSLTNDRALAQGTPGISPGPPAVLSREDRRVRLTWLESPGAYGPGNYGRRFEHGGRQRYYELSVPRKYDGHAPMPLVLVLHGGGGYAAFMRSATGMDQVAEREGFIVVYLAGTSATHTDRRLFWNSGFPTKDPAQAQVDDVGYVATVIDDIPTYFAIDKQRVYAAGISNGAMMTYRLAAELSDKIAAIGPVAGQRGVDEFVRPPRRPISVIHFHGRQDIWCPYNGGRGRAGRGIGQFKEYDQQAVKDVIMSWVNHNGCALSFETEQIGRAHQMSYRGGRNSTEVVLWTLEDGGHTWPGGKTTRFEVRQGVGKVNRDVIASELMWEFFQRHRLPE